MAELAAEAGVPTFTHARDLTEMVPDAAIDGAEEIVRAAGQTGAHMHYSIGPDARPGRPVRAEPR